MNKGVKGMLIKFRINGEPREMNVSYEDRLLDVIREDLGLTGTKEGCGEGECGACTVIMDNKNVASCLIYAYQANNKELYTIEGKNKMVELEIIENAYVDVGAVQCGYCIPGMIMSTRVLLNRTVDPTVEEIKKALEGNFCRCTGYVKIIEAVQLAAKRIKEAR
jgi:carbon-monoxide dehydrogenase small subunit